MDRAKGLIIAVVLVASSAPRAGTAAPLDVGTLQAAERRWAQATLQDYRFTFQYHEFVSPCGSWELGMRVVHGVPARGADCPKYRAEFGSVPLLFQYLRRALNKHPYEIEAEFDSILGYPKSASIAWSDTEDDFFSFEVVHFKSARHD
jgi:hypothetical protein